MTTDARHSKATPTNIGVHAMVAYEYADETARLAASGFDAFDLYKVAIDLDTSDLHLLADISPITWINFGNAAGYAHGDLSGVTSDQHHAQQHALAGSDHAADSLANLNSKISGATLDDVSGTRDPNAHGSAAHSGTIGAHSQISGVGADDHHAHANKAQIDLVTDGDHDVRADNPHGVTGSQVGLGNVTNDAQLKRAAADFATFAIKATPVGADLVLLEDSEAAGVKKKALVSSLHDASTVFGAEYQTAASEGESTTTGDTPLQKVKLTTTALPAGTYHLEYSFEGEDDGGDCAVRVQIDDTTTIAECEKADKYRMNGGQWDGALSGVTEIDVDFWQGKAGDPGVCRIRRTRLAIWRVA
jgi:hypothetical protein